MEKKVFNDIEQVKEEKKFKIVYDFVKHNDFCKLQNGKNDVDGINYVNVVEYETKEQVETDFEVHREFYDLHYIISGEEKIKWQDIKESTPTTEYDEKGDYQLFKANESYEAILRQGEYIIFDSNDIHKPGFAVGKTMKIRKAIFKIKK